MKIKMYTQPNCLYCKNIKEDLTKNEIEFEEIDISQEENREEWNLVTRLSGLGLTPTITFRDQIWAPNRDFQDGKGLIQRLIYFRDNPLTEPTEEDKFQIILNSTKNLAMSLSNLHQLIANISSKVNQLTTVPPDQQKPKPQQQPEKEELKQEETTTS
tara:strand:- start:60 stop:533 length:474 start_codon:yes stop_codon:yes gene_type:complete